jgi:hypothetical protein
MLGTQQQLLFVVETHRYSFLLLISLLCMLSSYLSAQFIPCAQAEACNACLGPFLQIANAIDPPQNIECTEAAADAYLKQQVPAGLFSASTY